MSYTGAMYFFQFLLQYYYIVNVPVNVIHESPFLWLDPGILTDRFLSEYNFNVLILFIGIFMNS